MHALEGFRATGGGQHPPRPGCPSPAPSMPRPAGPAQRCQAAHGRVATGEPPVGEGLGRDAGRGGSVHHPFIPGPPARAPAPGQLPAGVSQHQASARTIASLPWTLFTSLLTHRLVLLCIDAHCFISWDLPGDVLAAAESALGLNRCNTSLSLSLSLSLCSSVCGP